MVISIARQSVVIKCLRQKSVIVGNYEFYYAAGLMNKLFSLGITKDMEPEELMGKIQEKIDSIQGNNPQEEYLIKLVKFYEFLPNYDDQMKTLFYWGENEPDEWKINTSYAP